MSQSLEFVVSYEANDLGPSVDMSIGMHALPAPYLCMLSWGLSSHTSLPDICDFSPLRLHSASPGAQAESLRDPVRFLRILGMTHK